MKMEFIKYKTKTIGGLNFNAEDYTNKVHLISRVLIKT